MQTPSQNVAFETKNGDRPEASREIAVELTAVLVAVSSGDPHVMTIQGGDALPSGPLEHQHRSLQTGLRAWVEQQTRHSIGYVEQLYTFADRDRMVEEAGRRVISISYLGLTREGTAESGWRGWYEYFPWEDHRGGRPSLIDAVIAPALRDWTAYGAARGLEREHRQRADVTFGLEGIPWNEELVLQRYELLYEAGLVPEALRHRNLPNAHPCPGRPMTLDHRRILATSIARLRAKIKYRPVVFELMPPAFTLFQLQRSVEALAGRPLHKQNFRRLIEQQDLVEETGASAADTGGRPAKLFRFRPSILAERAVAGTKLPLTRS
jgi:hypothetical protein